MTRILDFTQSRLKCLMKYDKCYYILHVLQFNWCPADGNDQIKCICSVKWLQLNWCPVDGNDTEMVRLNIFVLLNDLKNIPALKININMKSWCACWCPCRCSHWWWRRFSWQTWPCRSWKNSYCISGNVHVEKMYI